MSNSDNSLPKWEHDLMKVVHTHWESGDEVGLYVAIRDAIKKVPEIVDSLMKDVDIFPDVDEYLEMVEKASAGGKYDDMFEFGYAKARKDIMKLLSK